MFVRWQSRVRKHPHPLNYIGSRYLANWRGVARSKPQAKIGNQTFTLRGKTAKPDVHLATSLVESVRKNGKPTQQHVAYLGGITETEAEYPEPRLWFWEEVTKKLTRLNLRPKERRRIEDAIAKRIPRPSKKQQQRINRDRDWLMARQHALPNQARTILILARWIHGQWVNVRRMRGGRIEWWAGVPIANLRRRDLGL